LAAILGGTLICVSFLIQIYFLTETMRVRIWIQSRDHLELKARLKAFKRFKKTIVALLVMLFVVSGMVYGHFSKNSESKLYNIFRIISSVILIVMFTVLGYH
jgi:p-aminobenzoyl-glutamate transporter AbgT